MRAIHFGYIDDVESTENNKKIINQKQEEREKLNKRLHNLIEMRADGEIDRDTFKIKKEEIEVRLQIIDKEIENLTPKENTVEDATHEEKMTLLRYYLEQSTNIVDGEDIPDDVIKAFIQKIVAHKDGFDFYLRFTPDDDPKKLNVEGRKDSAKVSSVCELQHRQLSRANLKLNNKIDLADSFCKVYFCLDGRKPYIIILRFENFCQSIALP